MVLFGPVLVERAKLALETLGLICPLGSICLFLFYSVEVDHFGFPERTLLTKKASILLWFKLVLQPLIGPLLSLYEFIALCY